MLWKYYIKINGVFDNLSLSNTPFCFLHTVGATLCVAVYIVLEISNDILKNECVNTNSNANHIATGDCSTYTYTNLNNPFIYFSNHI